MDLKGAKIRGYYHLGSVINEDAEMPRVFKIAHYQRPFKWREKNITKLINDHFSNSAPEKKECKPYFTGAVVTVAADGNEYHSLIDGQQRFTTLFLANYLKFLLFRSFFENILRTNPARGGVHIANYNNSIRFLLQNQGDLNAEKLAGLIELATDGAAEEEINENREKAVDDYCYVFSLPRVSHDDSVYKERFEELLFRLLNTKKLLLQYDRTSINAVITKALSKVRVTLTDRTGPVLSYGFDREEVSQINPYIEALKALFDGFINIAGRKAQSSSKKRERWAKDPSYKTILLIDSIDQFMNDLRFCVVQTGNQEDAYTLFEVLNDRALALDDLDIINSTFPGEITKQSLYE